MKITAFDKPSCRALRIAVEAKLQEVAKEFGIAIKTGNGTFTRSNFNFKVEACVFANDGTVLSKEAEEFKRFAPSYGLEASDLGKEFVLRGETYKIKGLSSRSTKFPIFATKLSDGKCYKFPEDMVKTLLKKVTA